MKTMKIRSSRYAIVSMIIVLFLTANLFAQTQAEKDGREIFEKYQTAIGGKESIAKIKTSEIIAEKDGTAGKSITLKINDFVNNKSYSGTKFEDGRVREGGWDGAKGWLKWEGGTTYLPGASSGVETPSKFIKLANKKINDKEYLVVEEIRPSASQITYYDPETFLLFRREISGNDVFGNPINPSTTYSDYRKVGDILVPFVEDYYADSLTSSTTKVLRVRHNIEVDPLIFEISGKSPNIERPK